MRLFLISAFLFLSSCVRVDESMRLFFPENLKELQFVQTQFSAFWWNFVIIEPDQARQPDFKTAEQICEKIKTHIDQELRLVLCGSQEQSTQSILRSWSQDYILRNRFDSLLEKEYLVTLEGSAVQASFIADKKLFSLFRGDPFQTWQDYLALNQNTLIDSFEKKEGYLLDAVTKRLIIPLQFQLSPRVEIIQPMMDLLAPYKNAFLIGSHGSTYQNEKQVRDDMTIVSIVGSIVLALFLLFLVFKSRLNILFLLLPVGVALYLATLITQMIDGSVHGLTLAFGSGIVGLALDYGLHGAFGTDSKQTWVSNAIGLLTTLCGVGILLLSGIPLIKQMMIFSVAGLGIGFFLFFILFKYYAKYFKIQSLYFVLPQIKGMGFVVGFLVLFGFYGAYKAELTMDLKKLSFVSSREADLTTWFFSKSKGEESFLLIKPRNKISVDSDQESSWAEAYAINYEGLSKYLPSETQQNENLKSWNQQGCEFFNKKTSTTIQKIYAPFIESICNTQTVTSLDDKKYLNHLIGETHILSIFNAKNENDATLIQSAYPKALSLTQALKNFSVSLEKDLKWMIPVSLFLTLFILGLYYRKLKAVAVAVLPFLTGLGLYFFVSRLFSFQVDLISILGLVMVFGFSIDYGVFSTDVHLHRHSEAEEKSVYTALTFAALTNILGFLPMLFAGHPVLVHLGCALFFGSLGTYLGTIYGVYPLLKSKKKK